jgi:hypothetical protein
MPLAMILVMFLIMMFAICGCTCGPYYATDPIYDQELRFPQRVVWLHIEGQCKVQL